MLKIIINIKTLFNLQMIMNYNIQIWAFINKLSYLTQKELNNTKKQTKNPKICKNMSEKERNPKCPMRSWLNTRNNRFWENNK
jgi:hypothetical protein